MEVGFIGLGAMGRHMAAHLAAAGHTLHLWARRPATLAALADLPHRAHGTPAALAAVVDVVFTVVTASADVEQVVLGEGGLIEGLRPGTVVLDMSTIAPGMARHVGEQLQARGAAFLDAPVSGGEVGAREASLAIMVGGAAEVLASVRPLLACLGSRIVHVGPQGAGQVAKACNQMIMVSTIQAAAEAMRLAAAAGVEPARVLPALQGGSAGSRVLEVMGQRMVDRNFAAGVEARLHHKDFGILMGEAFARGLPLPVAAQVWQQLNALMARGGGHEDTAALLKVLEGHAG